MIPPVPLYFVNARLIDPGAGTDGPGALVVLGDRIEEVVKGAFTLPDGADRVVDCRGLPLAPGIVDMRVFIGEPGARHRWTTPRWSPSRWPARARSARSASPRWPPSRGRCAAPR